MTSDPVTTRWRLDLEALPQLTHGELSPVVFRSFAKTSSDLIENAFREGVNIARLVYARARSIDHLLYHIWGTLIAPDHPQWSLVAVGGYGRAELHPHSDIDLLILLSTPVNTAEEGILARFVTLLWDAGIELGHSVRTVEECVTTATDDITIATNLMEARLLAGSPMLFDEMRHSVGPDRIWPGATFYQAKIAEQKMRHRRFHSSSYAVEPNIKKNPGGLRDLQVVGWVTKRHFQVDSLDALVAMGVLTAEEFKSLDSCLHFLWQVRFALHLVAGRREDRLLFDHQGPVAELLGYGARNDKLAVEQLMKRYFRTVLRIRELNDVLLQLFNEAILGHGRDLETKPIDADFEIRGDHIAVRRDDVFTTNPSNLLKLFLQLADHPELRGISATTIRLLQASLGLIDAKFRENPQNHQLFLSILSQHSAIKRAFVYLKRYGVLKRYLPVYAQIVGQMQFDLFHIYTVDEHTLFLLRNIARFAVSEHQHEFPLASEIVARMERPEIIYLAGLFHDIGKGRGGNHSELGALDAHSFCIHHGLHIEDAELVQWLVRHHLLMSMTAQRKDISDLEVIGEFATHVQDQRRLDMLYVLTIADIRATNPSLWNSWKGALLEELYHRTQHWLDSPDLKINSQETHITKTLDEVRELLVARDLNPSILEKLVERAGTAYIKKYSSRQIIWHCELLAENKKQHTVIKIRRHPNHGATEIFVYALDKHGLFAELCRAIFDEQLSIVSATIHTTCDGYCLNSFIVLEHDGTPIASARRGQMLWQSLTHRLAVPKQPSQPARTPRRYRHFNIKTNICFQNKPGGPWTELEVITLDRPGLLAEIAAVFCDLRIHLHAAKIATFGERAEDLFLVTGPDNVPLLETAVKTQLKQALVAKLDTDTGYHERSEANH